MAAQTLDDLPTPALILDRAILRRNLKRMSERLRFSFSSVCFLDSWLSFG